jgi:penicillin-binding protein 1A
MEQEPQRRSETESQTAHRTRGRSQQKKKKRPLGFLRGFFLTLLFAVLTVAAVASVAVAFYIYKLSADLPTATEMLAYKTNVASVIYDRNGEMIARLFTETASRWSLRTSPPGSSKRPWRRRTHPFTSTGGFASPPSSGLCSKISRING